jgi:hypothetical protein
MNGEHADLGFITLFPPPSSGHIAIASAFAIGCGSHKTGSPLKAVREILADQGGKTALTAKFGRQRIDRLFKRCQRSLMLCQLALQLL